MSDPPGSVTVQPLTDVPVVVEITDLGPLGEPSPLLPAGGLDGQVLTKATDDDQDAHWEDVPIELPQDGTIGQVLARVPGSPALQWHVGWVDNLGLPPGGDAGQVLTKNGPADQDADWHTPINEVVVAWDPPVADLPDLWYQTLTAAEMVWDAAVLYPVTSTVQHMGVVYTALTDTIGEDPSLSPLAWEPTGTPPTETTGTLNVNVNGEWVEVTSSGSGSGGTDEVWVSPDEPAMDSTVEVWFDTDEDAPPPTGFDDFVQRPELDAYSLRARVRAHHIWDQSHPWTWTLAAGSYLCTFAHSGVAAAAGTKWIDLRVTDAAAAIVGTAQSKAYFNTLNAHHFMNQGVSVLTIDVDGDYTFTLHPGGGLTINDGDFGWVTLIPCEPGAVD